MSPTPPSHVPGFLYKYTSVARALEVLLTGEVYFSHRQELNDPFDGKQMVNLSTRENKKESIKLINRKVKEPENQRYDRGHLSGRDREKYQKLLTEDNNFGDSKAQEFAEAMDAFNIGVYCFAEKEDSIIMWAHYANNHQGCCLEFNFQGHLYQSVEKERSCFPFLLLNRVIYSDRYPTHAFGEESVPHKGENSYMCKSKDWQYENEWRAIMYDTSVINPISGKSIGDELPDESIKRMKGPGHYWLDKDMLHGIILGYKMKDNEKKSIINAALSRGIRIYQAHPKLYEYGMEIKPWSNLL